MATNQHIDTFPLELLFLRMELAGFVLSPADRLRALQLLSGPGKTCLDDPYRLRGLLAPVLTRSEAEQQKFYELFDQYYHDVSAPVDWGSLRERSILSNKWWWLALALLIPILGTAWYQLTQRNYPDNAVKLIIDGPPYGSPGDTVRWKELSRLADQYADLKWRWLYVNPANPTDTLGSNTPNTWAFVVPPSIVARTCGKYSYKFLFRH
ncbi:MAG: hypothetical protein R2795_27255 [Saprospiraceae bacterium]